MKQSHWSTDHLCYVTFIRTLAGQWVVSTQQEVEKPRYGDLESTGPVCAVCADPGALHVGSATAAESESTGHPRRSAPPDPLAMAECSRDSGTPSRPGCGGQGGPGDGGAGRRPP